MQDFPLPSPGSDKDAWGPVVNAALTALKNAINSVEAGVSSATTAATAATTAAGTATTAANAATAAANTATATATSRQKVIRQYTDQTAAAAGLAANEFADGDLIIVLAGT